MFINAVSLIKDGTFFLSYNLFALPSFCILLKNILCYMLFPIYKFLLIAWDPQTFFQFLFYIRS